MDLSLQILCDLFIGPSTDDSIAGRFEIERHEASAVLHDCEIAGTVESYPLKCLIVWRLTPAGKDIAKLHPKNPKF